MIKSTVEAGNFLQKLANEPGALRVSLTPDGILRFEGTQPFEAGDFFLVHEGKMYARSGMTWFPFEPLPENTIDLCAFSPKRFALMKGDGKVDISSEKKDLDKGSSFLLCTKLPGRFFMIIADGEVCGEALRLMPIRDHYGKLVSSVCVREFVRKKLPDHLPAMESAFQGGNPQ